MSGRILIIQGHPDPRPERFCRALADAYARGAAEAGHELRRIDVAALDFPLLASKEAFEEGRVPESLAEAQETIGWASHMVIIHPLWLFTMPALLKGLLEQVLRPGFAHRMHDESKGDWTRLLVDRSARVVVTMGMPALAYRLMFRAHGLKTLVAILRFCGLYPVRTTVIGSVEGLGDAKRRRWLARMEELGRKGR